MSGTESKDSPLRVALCWLVVLIPLGWGVVQSVAKSMPLFRMSVASEGPEPEGDREDHRP